MSVKNTYMHTSYLPIEIEADRTSERSNERTAFICVMNQLLLLQLQHQFSKPFLQCKRKVSVVVYECVAYILHKIY